MVEGGVDGLAVSHDAAGQLHKHWDAAAGIDSAAVSLFVERAQGITPGFAIIDGDEAAAVTEICQRLDGIPLAIELAASRMASMTASEMRDRLDHRFRLLVGSRRGLERHHTLRHAVAWSYDLLDDTEKTVLDRCSVFAGGFDLADSSERRNTEVMRRLRWELDARPDAARWWSRSRSGSLD